MTSSRKGVVGAVRQWLRKVRPSPLDDDPARQDREIQAKLDEERKFMAERADRARSAAPLDERPDLGRVVSRSSAGASISFEYCDEDGVLTHRVMHNWIEYPRHIIGWNTLRRAQRHFRKDRVQEWHYGRRHLRRP